MSFSSDGAKLATTGELGSAVVWDTRTGQALLTVRGHTDWVSKVALSPDGTRMATAGEDRVAKVWDATNGQELFTLPGHTREVWDVAFSPDGTQIATASGDGRIKFWDAKTGNELSSRIEQSFEVYNMAFSPDWSRVAVPSQDNHARIWDIASGREVLAVGPHADLVASIAFSADGKRLATSSFDGKVRIWDSESGNELFSLAGHAAPAIGVSYSPDGKRLLTGSFDGTARIWNAESSRELLTLSFPGSVAATFSPDGTRLAIVSEDGTIEVRDLMIDLSALLSKQVGAAPAGKILASLQGNPETVVALSFSPDNTQLAVTGQDRTIRVWDLATGRELHRLRGHTGQVTDILYSPDGKRLATAANDYTTRLWDLTTISGQMLLADASNPSSSALAFSPDQSRLAVGNTSGTASIYDVKKGEELEILRGHSGEVWSIAYSPDGARLATGSYDRTAKLWDAVSGEELFSLEGHAGGIDGIVFSPDGTLLATASDDGTIKVWNPANGQLLATLIGHKSPVSRIGFIGDGRALLTAGVDGTVRIYLTQIEDLQLLAHSRVTRSFTKTECQLYLHLNGKDCTDESDTILFNTGASISPVIFRPPNAGGMVCMVSDDQGVHDQLGNEITFAGVHQVTEKFGWGSTVLESRELNDFTRNLNTLVESDCDLIIATTWKLADALDVVSRANPEQKFQLMDWPYETPHENVWQQIAAVDQAAFLAGYAAASVSKTGIVGTFGGINFPPVFEFMDGFAFGVAYYNDRHNANVRVLGWDVEKRDGLFIGTFESTAEGRRAAEELLDQGADVILPVAGDAAVGAGAAVKESGNAYLIGVDSDWTKTYPEFANVTLTSIEKRFDAGVVSAVQAIVNGDFAGGVYVGTLENGGVGIAPFHHLDHLVSAETKVDLEEIRAEIIAGKIKTKTEYAR
jgi:WD40 repeat protein/basic membrane lipoprotein Med (substrate-binding protein (PBP1-ABC) superfamily)